MSLSFAFLLGYEIRFVHALHVTRYTSTSHPHGRAIVSSSQSYCPGGPYCCCGVVVDPLLLAAAASYSALMSARHWSASGLRILRSYVSKPLTSPSTSLVWVQTPPEQANFSTWSPSSERRRCER